MGALKYDVCVSGSKHQKFFCWGIEGAKCDSEGSKIQKFAENN